MKLWLILLLLVAGTAQAQSPPVAATMRVQQKIVQVWQQNPDTSALACLYGHADSTEITIDSVEIAPACGAPAIGLLGFMSPGHYDEDDVLAKMQMVLRQRKDMLIAGEVYGITRQQNSGIWGTFPRVRGAWRLPA